MAKAYITKHSVAARDWPRISSGQAIGALGGQIGDALDLDLTDGAEHHTAAATESALYRVVIMGADVRLRIGADAVADGTGERWNDGAEDVRMVRVGERVSVKVDA